MADYERDEDVTWMFSIGGDWRNFSVEESTRFEFVFLTAGAPCPVFVPTLYAQYSSMHWMFCAETMTLFPVPTHQDESEEAIVRISAWRMKYPNPLHRPRFGISTPSGRILRLPCQKDDLLQTFLRNRNASKILLSVDGETYEFRKSRSRDTYSQAYKCSTSEVLPVVDRRSGASLRARRVGRFLSGIRAPPLPSPPSLGTDHPDIIEGEDPDRTLAQEREGEVGRREVDWYIGWTVSSPATLMDPVGDDDMVDPSLFFPERGARRVTVSSSPLSDPSRARSESEEGEDKKGFETQVEGKDPSQEWYGTSPSYDTYSLRDKFGSQEEMDAFLLSAKEDLCCPISKLPFRYPVSAPDGKTYECCHIQTWFHHSHTSPVTGANMQGVVLPTHFVRNAVRDWIESRVGS